MKEIIKPLREGKTKLDIKDLSKGRQAPPPKPRLVNIIQN